MNANTSAADAAAVGNANAGTGDAALLDLRGIHFTRDGKNILDDVNLTVRAGEIVTLIGPNGAGKSTLINIALGLLAADRGTVHRGATAVGYVPQKFQLDASLPLTVRRFLQLQPRARNTAQRFSRAINKVGKLGAAAAEGTAGNFRALMGAPMQSMQAVTRALSQVDAADLRALLDKPMQSISGGETRRVLLARALLCDPDFLVLDEPGAGMDVQGQAELYRLLQDIRARQRCGILLVSHDLFMVMAATDRVFCLNRHLCCSGRPRDVRNHPQFMALFGEDAARELAVYQHHHDHAHDSHGDPAPSPTNGECSHHHHADG